MSHIALSNGPANKYNSRMQGHLYVEALDAADALPKFMGVNKDYDNEGAVFLPSIRVFQEYFATLKRIPELHKFAAEVIADPVFMNADESTSVPSEAADKLWKKIERVRTTLQGLRAIIVQLTHPSSQIWVKLPPTDTLSDLKDVSSKLEDIFDYPLMTLGEPKLRVVGAEAGSTILGIVFVSAKGIAITGLILHLFFWFFGAIVKLRESISVVEAAARQRELGFDLLELGVKGLREQLQDRVGDLLDVHGKDLDDAIKAEAKMRICKQGADHFKELLDKGMEILVAANAPPEVKTALPHRVSLRQLQTAPTFLALPDGAQPTPSTPLATGGEE